MRILAALIKKESLQIIRDPSSILIAFVLPIILLFIFGYGVNLDNNKIKIGIVVEDKSKDVSTLVSVFTSSKFLDVKIGSDRKLFEDEIVSGKIRGMVVVPSDFSNRVASKTTATLQVISDGSEPNIAAFVQNYSKGVLKTWASHESYDKGVSVGDLAYVEPRFWYNPELKSRNFLIPGSIVIIMALIGAILTALVIAREWERGTMEAMLATPVSVTDIIMGKVVPYFILGMGSMVLCWIVAVFYYDVPYRGSLLSLFVVGSVFLLASLGQGLLISVLTKDQFLASQIALLSVFLPTFMLSGFIFEISAMPEFIRGLTYIFPARYFVTSLQTLFLVGDIYPVLIKCTAAIAFIGFVFFTIIALKTKKALE